MEIARMHGIGSVALANTNHWIRGGTYGWQAAKAGFVFIAWTNTKSNMPPWGASSPKLGNNPLVFAVPFGNEAIVLDMAMSQFSFGAMELQQLKQRPLPVPGGFDAQGRLTNDPSAVLESKRVLPIGYWKGAGLSLLLDILATILSGGLSVKQISEKEGETNVSQVFIAIDLSQLQNFRTIESTINEIITDYKSAVSSDQQIVFPGERVLQARERNKKNGIPVIKPIWDEVLSLL
jgi:3-dehydro-L-gulonate 2-dehydrogenase